ncbi:MAG: long-chain fatty acid--CoA ligase [Verrucomicrobia bacterium]|nr:long-chain fatty acid--CoA ligase [Verrucomicrobiota bacterium]
MNLATAFSTSAGKFSQKTAIFWGEDEYSFEQLWTRSLAVAHCLQNRFVVEPGDRVGLWLKNCPEFVPALFGVFLAGGVVVPINNFLKPDEVNYILSDAGIDVLITDASMGEGTAALTAMRPQLRCLRIEDFGGLPRPSSSFKLSERNESDLAVIIYTSGTTGKPKGAMLSHGNLLHNVDSCCQVLQAVGDDRFVVLLPMFHSFMLCVGVFLPLIAGGSMVLAKSLHPPKNVIQEVVHRKASILPAIPQFFRSLTSAPAELKLPLRLCVSGSAPLPAKVLKEFTERFSTPLLEGYGLSEASPVVSMNPLAGPWKAGSIGVPIPNVEVSVQNDAGDLLASGQTGEICVRGGNVMQGYWNQPEETAKALRNGWLLTGDVGHRDPDGYFYITDRKKDMLLVNGINVYPREIEEIIYHFPGVKEAAVIGMPDPRKGEQPVAFVAAADGTRLEEKALLQFVRQKLADYKVPRRVVFMAALPRNATGKILKTTLRQSALASNSTSQAKD